MQEKRRKQGLILFFFFYLIILLKLVIFKYPTEYLMEIVKTWEKGVVLEGLSTANFTLGKSIGMYIRYFPRLNGFENLFGNVLAFIPFGFLLPLCFASSRKWWQVMSWSLILVLGIELFQLFSAFGAFDVDDILLNMTGCFSGWLIYVLCLGKRHKGGSADNLSH
ncbi:MAG: VanZ family protein [Lachnospiraceae bacterium]|nr:VanZ family protein [Lachnospiraceae bacterium]